MADTVLRRRGLRMLLTGVFVLAACGSGGDESEPALGDPTSETTVPFGQDDGEAEADNDADDDDGGDDGDGGDDARTELSGAWT